VIKKFNENWDRESYISLDKDIPFKEGNFVIDENTGELVRILNSSVGSKTVYYLTYDQYILLKDYTDNTKDMVNNLKQQKDAIIKKLRQNVVRVINNNINEAIIIPKSLYLNDVYDVESLKQKGEEYGFDVVDYDDFIKSLSDEDKKTAPPSGHPSVPIFALFHPIMKKPMMVINNVYGNILPGNIISDILSHEFIHKGQTDRQKI